MNNMRQEKDYIGFKVYIYNKKANQFLTWLKEEERSY